jgi:hypothetical protein
MMDVRVHISADPALTDAIVAFAGAIGRITGMATVQALKPAPEGIPGCSTTELVVPDPMPEPAKTGPGKEAPVVTEPAKVEDEKPTVTLEQVRARLASMAKAGKRDAVSKMFKALGVTKLTEVKPEDYAALFEASDVFEGVA